MALTRREFTTASGAIVALTVLGAGCSREDPKPPPGANGPGGKKDRKAKLATEPFTVGPLAKYAAPGVYTDIKEAKGVWLVSDGKALVALSATCTHSGCTTDYDADNKSFECPCHSSEFDLQGINHEGGKAKRPLERCKVELVGEGSAQEVRVDPTKRFRKDKDEWDAAVTELKLADLPAATQPATPPATQPSES
ncbi:MAG: Rieske (2Fe-2S) protein [Planctomycetota bacterium]|nr:Rieske (2Fe-2S) protein [Planctomycetota bacterium]